jgi:hypothetical protein
MSIVVILDYNILAFVSTIWQVHSNEVVIYPVNTSFGPNLVS